MKPLIFEGANFMNQRTARFSALMLALSIALASCSGQPMTTREVGTSGGMNVGVPVVGPGNVMQDNSLTQQQIESQQQQIEQQRQQFQSLKETD